MSNVQTVTTWRAVYKKCLRCKKKIRNGSPNICYFNWSLYLRSKSQIKKLEIPFWNYTERFSGFTIFPWFSWGNDTFNNLIFCYKDLCLMLLTDIIRRNSATITKQSKEKHKIDLSCNAYSCYKNILYFLTFFKKKKQKKTSHV